MHDDSAFRGELHFASVELRSDREIVVEAVRRNDAATKHASRELRNEREIVLMSVEASPAALCPLPREGSV
eukprot:scaffold3447_cov322-Pinguiococcus_pyrenoidosus.AAC.3